MEVDAPPAAQEFKLRCELLGHHEDVRSVTVGEIGIVTGSRDTTIKIWADDAPSSCSLLQTLAGNKSYVGALAYAPPGFLPGLENGAVISGSFDGAVMVWDIGTGQPLHTYTGHQYQVTAVVLLPTGDIASASVDGTIKLWREGRAAGEIKGHEGPVLCLAVTEGGELLSGSGDTTIKRWRGTQCVQTYKGHTDTVRGLAILPGVGFVSGSHDCSLRMWSLEGDVLAELLGHTAIIYHVAATGSGIIASGSEDNTVRVWNASGSCLQVLEHPGCVWATAFTDKGELVSGCSDAVGRVWSSDPTRQADAETAAGFARLLEERKAAAAAEAAERQAAAATSGGAGGAGGAGALPPGVKVAEAHELMQPGSKDGETKLVREADGAVAAYGWSLASATWEKIGTVVDAPEAGAIDTGGRWYAGREWDRVFDVEMDSGLKLKLALDNGENPYLVADRFLEQHDLPQEFKEQIVQFILQNTTSSGPQQSLGDMPITGGFCDPFTGGGQRESAPQLSSRPPPAATPAGPVSVTGGFCDPFTGGASSSQPSATCGLTSGRQLPASVCLLFDAAPPAAGLRKKLLEFNSQLVASSPDLGPAALLTEQEAAPDGALDQLLGSLSAAASGTSSLALSPELMGLASRLLRWPAAQLFPALDIARCLALHPIAAQQLAAGAGSMSAPAIGGLSGALAAAAVSGNGPALQTGLKLVANCFKEAPLRAWVLQERELLLDGFAGAGSGPAGSKAVRLGLATVLLNYVVAARGSGSGVDEAAGMQLLSCAEDLLRSCPDDEGQAAHRAVLALGSLMVGPDSAAIKSVARDLGLGEQLQRFSGAGGELGSAVAEVSRVLAQQ